MNTLFAARAEARKNFESNRDLAAGSEELSKQITHAEEVAKFLRENVVQGQAAGEDNYSKSLHSALS
jgi:complex III assembly factor LYRM7